MGYFTLHVSPAAVRVGDRVCYYNPAGGLTGVSRVTRAADKRGNLSTARGEYVSFGEPVEIAFDEREERDARRAEIDSVECAYCDRESEPCSSVPAVDDDTAWTDLARHHLPSCEWILTRAHRRDVPSLTTAETAEIERRALAAARG